MSHIDLGSNGDDIMVLLRLAGLPYLAEKVASGEIRHHFFLDIVSYKHDPFLHDAVDNNKTFSHRSSHSEDGSPSVASISPELSPEGSRPLQ